MKAVIEVSEELYEVICLYAERLGLMPSEVLEKALQEWVMDEAAKPLTPSIDCDRIEAVKPPTPTEEVRE